MKKAIVIIVIIIIVGIVWYRKDKVLINVMTVDKDGHPISVKQWRSIDRLEAV